MNENYLIIEENNKNQIIITKNSTKKNSLDFNPNIDFTKFKLIIKYLELSTYFARMLFDQILLEIHPAKTIKYKDFLKFVKINY